MSKTVSVARTIVCPLESSQRKREYLRDAISQYQRVLGTMSDVMVSIDREHWESQNTTVARVAKRECDTETLYAHDRNDAAFKVAGAFDSRDSNGHDGDYPQFGDGDYIRICSCCSDRAAIEPNDRGYGLYVKVKKYTDGEWFHVRGGDFQYGVLDDIVNGDASLGNVELHLNDESVTAHVSFTREIETDEMTDMPRFLGVDVGERVLYAGAVRSRSGSVEDVQLLSGDEQRHHRDRLERTQSRRQASGALGRARGVTERRQYTEHVMHRASREIVDLVVEHAPCGIILEDLTGYREQAQNPIHDWPYGSLQEKVAYKAASAGIPVETVDAEYTSQTCRKCGTTDAGSRTGVEFECQHCGYTVHADVNAAMNIASRGMMEHG